MRKSVENLNIQPEFALIDGNSFKHETLKFQNIIKGDERSFTIAAASIIAKVTRDRLMRDLDIRFPYYGFAQHKGYGTRKHIEAIRKYGFCEVHRRSFHLSALHENLFKLGIDYWDITSGCLKIVLHIACAEHIHYFWQREYSLSEIMEKHNSANTRLCHTSIVDFKERPEKI